MYRLRRHSENPATGTSRLMTGVDDWHELLRVEEQRCAEAGFGAGVVTVELGDSVAAVPERDRSERALAAVVDTVAWTDRVARVAPGSIAVLVMPITEIHQLERLARRIDAALRAVGVRAAIGWCHRREGSDLGAAWARADANAATAQARHLRVS